MIHKHEIPILEFDDSPQAVIMPTHEDLDLDLPARCIYAFLEEEIERYANAVEADKVGEFVSATKTYPIFVNWLWRKTNHFNWNLWRFGKHEGKCFFDSY